MSVCDYYLAGVAHVERVLLGLVGQLGEVGVGERQRRLPHVRAAERHCGCARCRLYGYLPFYEYMTFVYVGACFLWLVCCFYHYQSVALVHVCIGLVGGLALAEMLAHYFDYRHYNDSGARHLGAVVFGILAAVLRRTLARQLVIAVALGVGVVKATLGTLHFQRIVLLGGFYGAFDLALELLSRYAQVHTHAVDDHWRLFLSLPVSVMNGIFYLWTSNALYATITQLKAKKQTVKLALYWRLASVIVVSLCAAIAAAAYQM